MSDLDQISNVTDIHSDHNESPNSSSDTNDRIVGCPRDEVWEYFTRTKCPKKKHCGKPTTLKSHLAIKCPKVSNDIRIKYLCAISDENSQEIADLSTTCPTKKLKSNQTIPLTAYYNLDKIDENKTKQANQALVRWFVTTLSGSVLDSEIATITLKLDKILKNATNLILSGAALREDIIEALIVGGNLKSTTKTRWSTAWNACDSMLHLENKKCNMFDNDNDNDSEEFADEESEEELTDIENENSFQLEIENFIELEHRMLNDDDAYSSSDVINHGDPDFDIIPDPDSGYKQFLICDPSHNTKNDKLFHDLRITHANSE
ncbi:46041_t:CDS:2 [Gigaspora margarita]|uniref:46041_t:CDS:1 n=1 Tax=Gigaspora margarita TaxID=4874 RepID=A0ABM8VW80_GIGMA|nr:46041_t:CDS:2 [Gigaspora margarita]